MAEALRHHRALLKNRAELDLITAELQTLVAESSVIEGVVDRGLYSRSETERLLRTVPLGSRGGGMDTTRT